MIKKRGNNLFFLLTLCRQSGAGNEGAQQLVFCLYIDSVIFSMIDSRMLENVKPVKILNLNFSKKWGERGKTVIYRNSLEKSWDFSISRMMKRIALLESSREI